MLIPSEGLTQLLDKVLPFHPEIVKAVNTLVELAASRNKRTLEEATLKPGSTETRSRKREEKMGIFLGFFRRLHTKNHRKPTLFRKVSCKKPKIGTLVTTEFGGGRYRSSIGICRGPGRSYSALHNKPESTHAGFLFVQICSVPKQNISHKLLPSPAIAWPQSQCICKDSPSNW